MIPSIQLVTTNNAPSVLEKFVLPITPNSSPMAAEQLSDQQSPQDHQNQHGFKYDLFIDDPPEEMNGTNGIPNTSTDSTDAADATFEQADYLMTDSDLASVECVTSENERKSSEHILMEVINIPISFCHALSPGPAAFNGLDLSPPQDVLVDASDCQQEAEAAIAALNASSESFAKRTETDDSLNLSENGNETNADDDENDNDSSSEQELTNLGWLIDLKNLTNWSSDASIVSHKRNTNLHASGSARGLGGCILDDIDDDDGCIDPIVSDRDLSEERFKKFTFQVKQ